jgi:hypothetical protein
VEAQVGGLEIQGGWGRGLNGRAGRPTVGGRGGGPGGIAGRPRW